MIPIEIYGYFFYGGIFCIVAGIFIIAKIRDDKRRINNTSSKESKKE